MWNNYFYQIRKKYSMRLSTKKTLIINLDGKDITKSKMINIIDLYDNSFLDNMEKTVQYFTTRYKCLAIFGGDEVSFIFENPMELVNDLNSDKSTYSTEVISVFSQYFYDYFNQYDLHKKVFWHGKCFSIPDEKIKSYIKYKSGLIQVLTTTYFLKKKDVKDSGKLPLQVKQEMCKQYADYEKIVNLEKGILYYNGHKIDIDEFLNGNIKILDKLDDNIFDDIIN